MLITRDRLGHLKTAGIKPGSFIKIFQGAKTLNGAIGEMDSSVNGSEAFRVYDRKPDLTWGSGVYFVKDDFYLVCLGSDYDSSD